jgi:RNase P subunit RPR2
MVGFIYIMSNPSFIQGRYKIGKSDRDPEEYRKYELATTGVPEPFVVEYLALVEDHHSLELYLHQKFSSFRVSFQREFFDVSVPEIITAIRDYTKTIHEKINYKSPEEIEKLKLENEKQRILNDKKRKEEIEKERQKKNQLILEDRRKEAKKISGKLIIKAAQSYSWKGHWKDQEETNAYLKILIIYTVLCLIFMSPGIGLFLAACLWVGSAPGIFITAKEEKKQKALRILTTDKNFSIIENIVLNGGDPSSRINDMLYPKIDVEHIKPVALPIHAKSIVVTCSICGQQNRIFEGKNLKEARCGKCKQALIENEYKSKPVYGDTREKYALINCINCNSEYSHIFKPRMNYLRCQLCSYEYHPEEIQAMTKNMVFIPK